MSVSLKKPQPITNIERISRMISFSNFGALKQVFIMRAIEEYAKQQLFAEAWKDNRRINQDAWKGIAQECLDDLKVAP